MKLEDNLIVYDNFRILKELEYCSLVEYVNIFNVKKYAIILNWANRVICDFYTDTYSYSKLEILRKQVKIFKEQKEKFKLLRANETIKLNGEYKLNDSEYLINLPYHLHVYAGYHNTYRPIRIPTYMISTDRKIFKKFLGETRETRAYYLNFKEARVNDKKIILYEYDENRINQLVYRNSNKIKSNWNVYNTETYGIAKNYDQESKMTINNSSQLIKTSTKGNEVTSTKLNNDLVKRNNLNDLDTLKDQDVIEQENSLISNKGNLEPEKKQRSFIATSRNLTIVKYLKYLKNLYKDTCQICGERIEVSPDCFLSEVHHMKPLGAHNGPDVTENMIVLCPNHHAMFDRGAITIDVEKKIVIHINPNNPLNNKSIELKHEINASYIAFHNRNIFISSSVLNQADLSVNKDEDIVDFGNIVTLQDMDTSELFEVKLEDRFNKDFMKPLEKVILQRCLNDIVRYNAFRYKIIGICTE